MFWFKTRRRRAESVSIHQYVTIQARLQRSAGWKNECSGFVVNFSGQLINGRQVGFRLAPHHPSKHIQTQN